MTSTYKVEARDNVHAVALTISLECVLIRPPFDRYAARCLNLVLVVTPHTGPRRAQRAKRDWRTSQGLSGYQGERPWLVLEGMDASRAHSLQQPMDRRYIDRWQIAIFGGLLGFTWWCRQASMNFERRLLRAGIWLMDTQKPRSR